jgi:hypothetical protein
MLPQAEARPVDKAQGLNEAKKTLEARKARGAAFGRSFTRMLPRAVARHVNKTQGLGEAKTAPEDLRAQNEIRDQDQLTSY